jgi:hypothetical protein
MMKNEYKFSCRIDNGDIAMTIESNEQETVEKMISRGIEWGSHISVTGLPISEEDLQLLREKGLLEEGK